MRMRFKPYARPELLACDFHVHEPLTHGGHWHELYARPDQPWHLELGCGKGGFLAQIAPAHPDINYLGIDIERLGNAFTPEDRVSRIYINFCNPWSKNAGSNKHRLTHPRQLLQYRQLMDEGAEIWFKTDNDPLFAFSLEQFEQEGWELREVTHDLHADGPVGVMTDYEAKFYDQGITINRCVAVKTEDTKCDLYPGTSTGCAPV